MYTSLYPPPRPGHIAIPWVWMCACKCVTKYKHAHIHMYICTHGCTCIYNYLHLCAHMYTHTYTYAHWFTCIPKHTCRSVHVNSWERESSRQKRLWASSVPLWIRRAMVYWGALKSVAGRLREVILTTCSIQVSTCVYVHIHRSAYICLWEVGVYACICMYVYVYCLDLCLYMCTNEHIHIDTKVHLNRHKYTHVEHNTQAHMGTYSIHLQTHMHTKYTCICTYIQLHHVCVCTHSCIHVYAFMCIMGRDVHQICTCRYKHTCDHAWTQTFDTALAYGQTYTDTNKCMCMHVNGHTHSDIYVYAQLDH